MRSTETGAALIITLMLTAILALAGGALVFIIDVETAISANHRAAQEVRDAAQSGIECALAELSRLPDWTGVPDGSVNPVLRCIMPGAPPRAPDGRPLDVPDLTAGLQALSDRRYARLGANPDAPGWVVLAGGPVTTPRGRASPFVVLWLADDVDDRDGQPRQDSNGVVLVHAEAFGSRGARSGIEVLAGRVDGGPQPSTLRLLAWREVR